MADPHLLYVVSAVVLLGLVAWVIVVVARAPDLPDVRVQQVQTAPPAPSAAEPRKGASEAPRESVEPASQKRALDAHLEIQDEKRDEGKKGS